MPPGVSVGSSRSSGPSGPSGLSVVAGRLSRRVLLAGGVMAGLGGGLAACTGADGGQGEEPADDTGLRRRAAREGSELLARYEATAEAHPGLAETLAPFRDVVAAHVAALAEDGRAGAGGGAAPGVPAEEPEAVAALVDAERETARQRYRAVDGASPELARLLASMAAAGSAQAYLLSEARP
ncbi:hypothetical protein [Streptomyces sp. 6N223]|uniref:hypothetical protein n=1 Tax=Streptomyces sp. 6N223 TaxID=3457412 RepID=UPI003FD487D5